MKCSSLWRAFALTAALGMASAAAAQSQEWRVLTMDGDGEHGASVAYVDTSSIARSEDEVRFDMLVLFQNPPPDSDRLRGRMRADCSGRRWGAESSATYLGTTLVRRFGPVALEAVPPGTNAAGVLDAVCNGRYLSGPVDPDDHSSQLFRK